MQLEKEGMSPGILYDGHPRSMLDNFSESRILLYSYYMDTGKDPKAILDNPGWIASEEAYSDETMLHDFYTAVKNKAAPNTSYEHYCMGFRAIVRSLLAVMPYMDMRQCILWAFCLLLGAVLLRIYQSSQNFFLSLGFMFTVSQMNPTVISGCFQYATCFIIAFAGMLACFSRKKRRISTGMLFFLLGAVTQYLDYYTVPILTFGLPMLAFLIRSQSENDRTPLLGGDGMRQILKLFVCWFSAYVLTWLTKLVLASLFTEANALLSAFERIQLWLIQPSSDGSILRTIPLALFYCAINVVDVVPLIAEAVFFIAYIVRIVRIRATKRVLFENAPYLLTAFLPLLWIVVSAKPSYEHMWFQYRGLCVTMYGLITFMVMTAKIGAKDSPHALHVCRKKTRP